MAVIEALGAIKPVAKVLLKVLELVDPKTRDWARKRHALEFAEQYILKAEELLPLLRLDNPTFEEKRRIRKLEKNLRFRKKWFFQYD